jgi:protein required for attachment to host cells
LHQRDVESDAQGRFFESAGPKHSGQAATDFKHRTAVDFARHIVGVLKEGKSDNAYGRLVLIAPAMFLGVLRAEIPDAIQQLVIADLNKDLSQADIQQISSVVQNLIFERVPEVSQASS